MFLKKKNDRYPINKKRIVKSKKIGKIGRIYLLSNPCFHLKDTTPIYKLGHTLRTPSARAWELYNDITSVPEKFEVEYFYNVPSGYAETIEKLAHKKLKPFRVNKYREFFACHITICQKAIEEAKAEVTIKKNKKNKVKQLWKTVL